MASHSSAEVEPRREGQAQRRRHACGGGDQQPDVLRLHNRAVLLSSPSPYLLESMPLWPPNTHHPIQVGIVNDTVIVCALPDEGVIVTVAV